MREIVVIERDTAARNGRTVLRERKYHGLLLDDGSFRLLACCGKRFPLPHTGAGLPDRTAENKKTAA